MSEKIRLEGLTLTVEDVTRSLAFYTGELGLETAWNAAPAFAMIPTATWWSSRRAGAERNKIES